MPEVAPPVIGSSTQPHRGNSTEPPARFPAAKSFAARAVPWDTSRVRLLPLLLLLLGVLVAPAPGASAPPAQALVPAPASPNLGPSGFTLPPGASVYGLRTRDAVILGVIEGVTEYLPVSSTGHLIIASRVLRLDSQQPVLNALGEPVWHVPPERGRPGELLTQKLATDTYIVIIQVGALLAVALLYWRQLWSMALGACGRDPGTADRVPRCGGAGGRSDHHGVLAEGRLRHHGPRHITGGRAGPTVDEAGLHRGCGPAVRRRGRVAQAHAAPHDRRRRRRR